MTDKLMDDDWAHLDQVVDMDNVKNLDQLEHNIRSQFTKKDGTVSGKLRDALIRRWKDKRTLKAEMEQQHIRDVTTRRNWMTVKEEVKSTGKPAVLKEDERFQVRVIRHGKGTSTVVLDKDRGSHLKRGSKREREALLGML